jgi:hypothetical protein
VKEFVQYQDNMRQVLEDGLALMEEDAREANEWMLANGRQAHVFLEYAPLHHI